LFPTAHPDQMGQLATERAEGLRAAAARFRLGRPTLPVWRPARFTQPTPGPSRVTPPALTDAADAAGASGTDRAA
jgi:hypothetical protein